MGSSKFALVVLCVVATACGRYGYASHHGSDAGADMLSIDASPVDSGEDAQDLGMDASDLGTDATDFGTDATDFGTDASDFGTDAETPLDMTVSDGGAAGIIVMPISGLMTTELGGSDSFTIRLARAPTSDVSIELSSSDELEATVAPASIVFTMSNWESEQTVTVTGVADGVPDGNQAFTITTDDATSLDADYAGLDADDVTGTNYDDATPGVLVVPTSGLVTTEAGGTATFTVVLQSPPTVDVGIPLSVTDATEGSVDSAMAVFTNTNWNVPQMITVTGEDDDTHDGDVAYQVTVGPATGDPDYVGVAGSSVDVTNTDDETPGFAITPVTSLTSEDGTTDTLDIVLASRPTATVTFAVSSADASEGAVAPALVSISPATWDVPRTVTVTGIDDALADGNIEYDIVVAVFATGDPEYAALASQNATYTNTDNDTPGIAVAPTSGLTTTEAGGTATFTIAINTRPIADVTVAVSSDTLTEGTVSPASVTFTNAAYAPQMITVTGVNDSVVDGARVYHIVTAPATSTDGAYNTMNPHDVTVTNTDDDVADVIVSPTSGLVTTETGGTTSFTVRLGTQPNDDVMIPLMSSDTSEGTIALPSLTFTNGNWNVPQTVVVTGVNDSAADGNIVYAIITGAASSTDMTYNAFVVDDVSVTNNDNDTASIVVMPTSGLTTTEAGGTATFTVVLTSMPSSDVSIALSSSDTTEGTVAPASITFTDTDWNMPQTVTLTGVDDFLDDGNVAFTAITAAASSADASYNGLAVANVSCTNTDDDSAGVMVSPTSGLVTTEAGGTATFTIVLGSAPSADVSISLTSSNTNEGHVTPAVITFTGANWNVPQTITVVGYRDGNIDGNVGYTVVTSATSSADPSYSSMAVSDVSVINNNVDAVGVTITPISGLVVSENRTTASFLVTTGSAPVGGGTTMSIGTSDSTEGTVNASIVGLSWQYPSIVTVTGVDDTLIDGDQAFSIITGAVSSPDPAYNGMVVPDVGVTTTDNDTGDIIVTPNSRLVVTEMASTTTFSVRLGRAPTANVVIGLSSNDTGEGTVLPAMLTFTMGNWSTPQTVTVTGVADATLDGEQTFSIVTAPATSTDLSFSGQNGPDASITTIDVDAQRCITCNGTTYLPTYTYSSTAPYTPVSADGRYVIFEAPTALIASDTNGFSDIYVRDRQTGSLSIASVSTAGVQGTSSSSSGAISRDGRYVVFHSNATNLVVGDTNAAQDAFVRDRTLNTTTRISLTSAGGQIPSGTNFQSVSISDDGRYVLFGSDDATVVAGDTNGMGDFFVRDTIGNTTTRVSVRTDGSQFTGTLTNSAGISGDGRYFLFSTAQSGVPSDTNSCLDVFRRDLMTGIVELVSTSPSGGVGCHNGSAYAQMSGDGRYVSFRSDVIDLVANDTNGVADAFVRDMVLGITTLASVNSAGVAENAAAGYDPPSVSDDGRRVVFVSEASNLVAGDSNNRHDVFLHDFMTGTTTLVSSTYDGTGLIGGASHHSSIYARITPSGTGVIYRSEATNVLAEIFDNDNSASVFYVNTP